MSKSKLTLVVDGNWVLMSRLSVMQNRFADEYELMKDLKILMTKSINVVLRTIPTIDNIIVVGDGGSWRNWIEVPSFLKKDDVEYKGNRVKSEDLNWDVIFQGYEEWFELLKDNSIYVSRERGVEGDDWCAYWSKKLNANGTNCIIWSKDKDLTQLVNQDEKTGIFTVCWNKDYVTLKESKKEEDDMNFLFSPSYNINEQLLESIIGKTKDTNYINPMDVVIDKIIRGDLGDNVLPIVTKSSSNGTKTFRVGNKEIDFTLDIDDNNAINEYISNLLNKKSWKGKVGKPVNEIVEHFYYNKRLVYLDKSSYPEEIIETMNKYDVPNDCNKDLSDVESKLLAEKNSSIDVFESI